MELLRTLHHADSAKLHRRADAASELDDIAEDIRRGHGKVRPTGASLAQELAELQADIRRNKAEMEAVFARARARRAAGVSDRARLELRALIDRRRKALRAFDGGVERGVRAEIWRNQQVVEADRARAAERLRHMLEGV